MTHAKEKCEVVYGISNFLITWNNHFTNACQYLCSPFEQFTNLTRKIMYKSNILLSLAQEHSVNKHTLTLTVQQIATQL